MPFDPHERARLLIDKTLVAGITQEDECWLRNHTAACEECGVYARLSQQLIRGLNSLSFEMDPGVTSRVQNAVTAQAQRLAAGHRYLGVPAWRWVSIAAAVLILLVAAPVYIDMKGKRQEEEAIRADALLLERVRARVSRVVPEAMEPLLAPPDQLAHGETR